MLLKSDFVVLLLFYNKVVSDFDADARLYTCIVKESLSNDHALLYRDEQDAATPSRNLSRHDR